VRQRRWVIIVATITIVRSANLTTPNGSADLVREHAVADSRGSLSAEKRKSYGAGKRRVLRA
jgi:hypothetical protein